MVAGSGFENCGRARRVGWRTKPTVELEIEGSDSNARFGSMMLQLDSLLTVGVPVGVLTAGSPLGSVKYGGSGGSEAQPPGGKSGEEGRVHENQRPPTRRIEVLHVDDRDLTVGQHHEAEHTAQIRRARPTREIGVRAILRGRRGEAEVGVRVAR